MGIMTNRNEKEVLRAVASGDATAFEQAFGWYEQRVRVAAWRISHRADWIDELVHEAWCRAFDRRTTYDPERPFLLWMAGIVQNVYREQCRRSPLTLSDGVKERRRDREDVASVTPEAAADTAEILAGLNDCLGRLPPEDGQIVRMRFFEGKTLREISVETGIPESTLRAVRLAGALETIRKCMHGKGLEVSEVFPAQRSDDRQ